MAISESIKTHLNIDKQRFVRIGQPEVILAENKSRQQLETICNIFNESTGEALFTRVNPNDGVYLSEKFSSAKWIEEAACLLINNSETLSRYSQVHTAENYQVSIVSGGSSDFQVCHEAALTLAYLGIQSRIFPDVGVAGIHRFFDVADTISLAKIILVVAGMDAALVSVCGGYFHQPIIAIPTSTGYGTAYQGQTALNASLTSCAQGVTVVNIDNGFGAASAAARMLSINRLACILP